MSSILTQSIEPTVNEGQLAFESMIRSLRNSPKLLVDTIFSNWVRSFDLLHAEPTSRPAKLEALGTDAGEMFALNTALCQFLVTNLTGKRDDIVAEIQLRLEALPELVFNEDGTVTEA
jgi:hypothetical protein